MNIAGVGLEQDVAMENVDMKIGPVTSAAGMAGSAASPHLLYFVILSVFRDVCGSIFGRLQAVGRYVRPPQGGRARRAPVLPLPTLCLALAFVLFNAAGAMAQPSECTGVPANDPPECNLVADAGSDARWNSGVMVVTLDGSDSSPGTGAMIESYDWKRTGGTGLSVADLTGEMPTFMADTLMPGGPDVTHEFTLTVTNDADDTATDQVTITINAPPKAVVKGAAVRTVASGTPVTLDGSDSEDSVGMLTYAWTRPGVDLTGETASILTFDAPTLSAGDPDMTHVYTLTVADEGAKTSLTDTAVLTHAATVTITVEAPPFPELTANAGANKSVASEGTVTLDGSGTATGSGRMVTYLWTRPSGTGGMLTGETTLTPSFKAPMLNPGDPDATHTFTLTVSDDQSSMPATSTVTVTVTAPPFPELTANAGANKSVASEGTVTLDGSGTATGSGRMVTYLWTRPSGTGGMLTGETTLTPSFKAPMLNPGDPDATHTFTLTVSDDQSSMPATSTVTVTVTAPPFPELTANAGANKSVASEGTVTLDGSGTATGSGRMVTYLWTRPSGTGGMLTGETTLTPSFKAPMLNPGDPDATHTFTLTVSDDQSSMPATSTVTVTVTAPPFPELTANAGANKSVASEGTVTLDGSGTATGSGRMVTYLWTRPSGTGGMLTGETTLTPSFKAPMLNPGDPDATHTFTLTVSDDQSSMPATSTVTVTVTAPPFPELTANAGANKSVASEGTVTLDGSGTATGSGRMVTYLWTRPSGTGGMLTGETTLTPSFKAPMLNPGDPDATHTFTLTVSDDQSSMPATSTVTVTVTAPPFPELTANAGANKSVASEGTVTLDGSGTATGSGRMVTYLWTRPSGTGGMLTGETTLTPSFKAPMLNPGDPDATHTFTLTVSDDQSSMPATSTVTVTVTAPPFPELTANAGANKSVASEGTVTLDGSGTATGSGRMVTYLWTRPSGTGGMLTGETTLTPSFKAPMLNPGDPDATHTFTLTVSDDQSSMPATSTVTVTVTAPPFPELTANAGANKSVASEGTVTLDGSGTATGSGRMVTYLWTRPSGTGGMLTGETTLTPSFKAPMLNPGDPDATHTFTLTVSDDQSSMPATSTVTVTVTALSVDIVLDPPEVSVQEGGSGTYRIRLSESPGRAVTIMATSGNEAVVRLKNTRLVFNAGNWNDWQEVEIDAVADSVKKGDGIKVIIQHSLNGVASNKLVTVSVRAQEDDPILDHVGQFIATRATTLLGQQPDLIHFLKQDGLTQDSGGSFTFQATDGRLSLDGGFIHDGTWGEVTGARTNSESTDTKSVLGSFGIHRKYSETFLTGLMLQFDRADHELPQQTGTIDGTGWLVGPYFVARHGSQPLYFEGRLLYGYSDNDIRFMDRHLGARTGSFDSTRVLAQIRVEGEIAVPGWDHGDDGGAEVPQLIPYADLRWLEDRAAAFTTVSATTGFRVPVPGQTVNISQLELGSNMVVPVAVPTGSMILTGGLGLVFSNTEGNHIKSDAHGRGRGEIGFSYGLDENVQIDFESFYDGIGSSGYEGYGLSLNAEMRF